MCACWNGSIDLRPSTILLASQWTLMFRLKLRKQGRVPQATRSNPIDLQLAVLKEEFKKYNFHASVAILHIKHFSASYEENISVGYLQTL